jgi:hypothetical protein
LAGQTPLARFQQDLPRIRTLGQQATQLDAIFHHRVPRKVRQDGTVSYQGRDFEVPYELSGQTVQLVVNPHAETVVGVENDKGQSLGAATPLDAIANAQRRRRRPDPDGATVLTPCPNPKTPNPVELAYQHYHGQPKREDP